MKKITLFLIIIFLSTNAFASEKIIDCFVVRESQNYLIKEGKHCETRYSPASTFKIALALFGFEEGILKDENHPIWKSKEPVTFLQDYWSGEKTPASWMRFSIVWYSQILTNKLGIINFQNYIDKLNYGNRDLSGGLTQAWLSSSLLISPLEQINFVENLAKNDLPFSKESQIKSKNLIRLFDESLLSNGWILYGKTGTDIDKITGERRGYFVGFATKGDRLISFVIHITGEKTSKVSGIYSKKIAIDKMMSKIIGI